MADNKLCDIMVSVCVVTYNHESYIEQALESIKNQQTGFLFEVIICNDCSTDNSNQIIDKFIRNSFSSRVKIKYFNHKVNIGMMFNFEFALKQCSGKYVALCDGDDYWTDPIKLQKQVDFLEANPEVVLCYHPVNVLFPDGKMEEDYLVKDIIDKKRSNIYDMAVLGNYIHTPSVVFRNVIKEFPLEYYNTPIADFFLYMLLGQYGDYFQLQDNMAVYRYGVGSHSAQSSVMRSEKWNQTLSLISEAIGDNTIKQILKLRIEQGKINTMPKAIRELESFRDIGCASSLVTYATINELLKSIFLKIRR